MKALLRSFALFICQIWKDSMLIAVAAAPILAACFFRFGIPPIERILCGYFGRSPILTPYYLLFDLLLTIITPYMFCFASSMVMLTEYDENLSGYLSVTPVEKRGYVVSRLVFPAILSLFASLLLVHFFSLTAWTWGMLLIVCLLSSLLSISISLLLFSFSHNRIEGMAMAKLSGLLMLGLPVPFFLPANAQYLFSPLPSFWIAKLALEPNGLFLPPAIISLFLWLGLPYRKFKKKLG